MQFKIMRVVPLLMLLGQLHCRYIIKVHHPVVCIDHSSIESTPDPCNNDHVLRTGLMSVQLSFNELLFFPIIYSVFNLISKCLFQCAK